MYSVLINIELVNITSCRVDEHLIDPQHYCGSKNQISYFQITSTNIAEFTKSLQCSRM